MAINKYTRRKAVQLTANFTSREFDCKGTACKCTVTRVDSKLVRKLQVLRNRLGKSITINSGNRCQRHNAASGGTSSSYHLNTKGKAADIRITDRSLSPSVIALHAQEVGFTGIGMYDGSAGHFVHVDTRPTRYFWKNTAGRNVACSGHGGKKQTCPYKLGSTTLRKGDTGESVRAMQWILDWSGYDCEVDGDFGEKTESALKAFQRGMCLKDDGVCGRNTLTALKEVAA